MSNIKSSSTNIDKYLKIPPHSQEAEQSVLGGVMLSNDSWDQVIEKIGEQDFYEPRHKLLFRTMKRLTSSSQPIDVVTVSEELAKAQELNSVGGMQYLIDLVENTPSAANISAYAGIVRERSVVRQLISACTETIEQAFSPEALSSADLLDRAETKVFNIANQNIHGTGPVNIKDILKTTIERIDQLSKSDSEMTGVSTGFEELDKMTSGLQPSDLIIVAGRPSMGKTLLGVNIAEHVAVANPDKVALVFSLEMPAEALTMRLISSLGRIEQTKLRVGEIDDEDAPRFASAVSQLSGTKLFIDDTPSLSPGEIRARARRIVRDHGEIGVIVIDYLQLMQLKDKAESRAYEVSEISRSLKALAKELKVPVVALSQLNRELEKRINKRPVMSDLRESGSIEQDADVIAFIYRDEVYHEDSPDKGMAEIIIGKQRNGPIGTVRLQFFGSYCRFDNPSPDYYDHASY